MRTLYLDIETTPNLAYVWRLWRQNVSLSQLVDTAQVLCVAWKWRGERPVQFAGINGGHQEMLDAVHAALTEAELVVHYNGKVFDIPHLNRAFVMAGMKPPAPYAQLDILSQVRKQFRFPSNKLAHVSEALGLEGKVEHSGFNLWVRCMAGEASAWQEMERYNKRDVLLLEELHDRLSGWLPGSPNARLLDDRDDVCPQCGSDDLRREGHAFTQVGKVQRWQCRACGAWSRSSARVSGTQIRSMS
ncbi:ribonuclease H-like domain-containing protein [Micromonospora sp. NBC_01813]|uniref:ribonuclease H-like domain-containing protein n=1 Tax=Micromonospora sp. NBC_01813 TaxID=2975988 RepID=UPI002DD7DAAB|nr:ribonuclease H-like domain-containing protein [Micromonospora sp. NBC_01813]WSA11583.1 ribonuclease H-like domain-containing protein [Micromonospora sp. NBC_01813]